MNDILIRKLNHPILYPLQLHPQSSRPPNHVNSIARSFNNFPFPCITITIILFRVT